jgi:hypothetical protein
MAGLANDARRIEEALRASASRPARLRALLAPRSAVRVMWAASAAWTTLGTRVSARWEVLLHRPSNQNS